MKIAICSTFLGQKTSGGEISAFHLAKNLSDHGDDVFVVTSKIDRKFPFKAYSIPFLRFIPNIALLIGNPLFDVLMTWRMKTLFKKERPDVVHVQDASLLIPALRAAKSIRSPVVMTVRDYRFTCNLSTCLEDNRIEYRCSKKDYHRCLKRTFEDVYGNGWIWPIFFPIFYWQRNRLVDAFRRVKRYVAVSDFIKKEVIRSGIDKEKIRTILVQKEDWTPGEGKYIFTAGGLKGTKGFDFLLNSFKGVVQKKPDAKLRIAGDGSAKARLVTLTKRFGIEKNVDFLGTLRREKIRKEYAQSIFVVSPSLWPEPLSRIIFEAFSSRKTIVATDVGGSSELVKDGKTGLLVKPGDEKAFANAMIRLIDDTSLRKKMAQGAHDLIERCCNAEANYRSHMALYEEVIG